MKVFLNKALPEAGMHLLKHPKIELIIPSKDDLTRAEWLEYCKKSDVVISVGKMIFDQSFFEECPNVKAIALFSVGYDHVDISAATQHKVVVTNTPEVLSKATSDVAFLLMQMIARKAVFNIEKVKNGKWTKNFDPSAHLGQELYGKTLGVFGLGRIGLEMAKKCKNAFDMKIMYHNRSRNEQIEKEWNAQYVSFDELIKQADVLSIHANYTSKEKHLFNATVFSKMKSNAILVNTARGGFINEHDLYSALKSQTIFGAGLDVTETEPLLPQSPLLTLDNVAILPHIGSATIEARNGMAKLVAQNVIAFVEEKQLPSAVNQEALK